MDKIIYNIATYRRRDSISKTIESIYNQCDIINLSVNDYHIYDDIPDIFYDKKINLIITDNSKGDAFKFSRLVDENGYFFTVDDDLIYPKNYTEYMIDKFNQYGGESIITLHGRNFNRFPINSYYNSKGDRYHCLDTIKKDVKVQFGGTGVMCFHTNLLKVGLDYFKHPNMADIWISKIAKEKGIPITCVSHDKNYLSYIKQTETIFDSHLNNDEIQTNIVNEMYGYDNVKLNKSKIVILSTLWNATNQIPQFVNSIKTQTYKDFKVIVVDDNSSDGSFLLLKKLTDGDNRFTIIRNNTQKFKTQNFYEVINDKSLITNDDIIIELDGDDAFYGKNVVEKVHNDFKDSNLWIAGYKWIDNKGQKSPFKYPPNADNPRSQIWAYSAMRVFKAFLFRNIKQQDLMFEGQFVKAANDVAYGMPMLEMSGKEHFRSFNDVTYLYNLHDKNTHSKKSSVRDPGLQKRTEKHIYSLPRYSKLKFGGIVNSGQNVVIIPKVKNIENSEKINKIKGMVPIVKPIEPMIEVTPTVQKIVNVIPKITNNSNIKKIISKVITKTNEEPNTNLPPIVKNNSNKVDNLQSKEVKDNPKVRINSIIVKPQNKEEINKKREEFENILLFGPNGKKQINPIPPKSIGISI